MCVKLGPVQESEPRPSRLQRIWERRKIIPPEREYLFGLLGVYFYLSAALEKPGFGANVSDVVESIFPDANPATILGVVTIEFLLFALDGAYRVGMERTVLLKAWYRVYLLGITTDTDES